MEVLQAIAPPKTLHAYTGKAGSGKTQQLITDIRPFLDNQKQVLVTTTSHVMLTRLRSRISAAIPPEQLSRIRFDCIASAIGQSKFNKKFLHMEQNIVALRQFCAIFIDEITMVPNIAIHIFFAACQGQNAPQLFVYGDINQVPPVGNLPITNTMDGRELLINCTPHEITTHQRQNDTMKTHSDIVAKLAAKNQNTTGKNKAISQEIYKYLTSCNDDAITNLSTQDILKPQYFQPQTVNNFDVLTQAPYYQGICYTNRKRIKYNKQITKIMSNSPLWVIGKESDAAPINNGQLFYFNQLPALCPNWQKDAVIEVEAAPDVFLQSFPADPRQLHQPKMTIRLAPGWVISVHNAQGNSFPNVIYFISPEDPPNLMYTAVTRAAEKLIIATPPDDKEDEEDELFTPEW